MVPGPNNRSTIDLCHPRQRGLRMVWTLEDVLWAPVVFGAWYAGIRLFVAVSTGIVHRELPGWVKAGWIVLAALPPFLGVLVYLLAGERPPLPRVPDGVRVGPVEYERFRHRASLY
jgi:hypothetical protein